MKPEQAKNMIDTINDGREYVLPLDEYDTHLFGKLVIDHEAIFINVGKSFEVKDPDKAREIAVALMTWVEMKEGQA